MITSLEKIVQKSSFSLQSAKLDTLPFDLDYFKVETRFILAQLSTKLEVSFMFEVLLFLEEVSL